jgi:hypothetical protein
MSSKRGLPIGKMAADSLSPGRHFDASRRALHPIDHGGLYFVPRDNAANFVKSVLFFVFLIPYVVLFGWDFGLSGAIGTSICVAVLVFAMKVSTIYINRRLDAASELPEHEEDSGQLDGFQLPPGVSIQLWHERDALFARGQAPDERAMHLIQRGHDPDAVFTLAGLVRDGTVTRATVLAVEPPHVKTNLIELAGRRLPLRVDHDMIARICVRPPGFGDASIAALVGFAMTMCTSFARYFDGTFDVGFSIVLCSLSIMSMLLPPPCDPYSTTLNDATIGFTRPIVISVICISIKLITVAQDNGILADDPFYIQLCMLVWKLLPVLVVTGFVGYPVTLLHWLLEVINKYAFGLQGSASLLAAFVNFAMSGLCCLVIGLVFGFGGFRALSTFVVVVFAAFAAQWTMSDFPRLRAVALKRLIAPGIAAVGCVGLTVPSQIFPNILALLHLGLDFAIPMCQTHQKYFIVHGKFLDIRPMLIRIRAWYRRLTVPFLLSWALAQGDCSLYSCCFLPLIAFRLAESEPHIFAFGLALWLFTLRYDFQVQSASVSFLLGLLISEKTVRVMRVIRCACKMHSFPSSIFQDPVANPAGFAAGLVVAAGAWGIFHFFGYPSYVAIAWNFFSGASPAILYGFGRFLGPSAPRPNSFWDSASTSCQHDGFRTIEPNHHMEVPVYVSMVETLERSLYGMIREGRLGPVTNDSFFLFTDDDLVVIIHIIAIEPNCIHFQMRGLEYVQQTICHNGELSIIQQMVLEQRDFWNVGHAIAFNFTMFDLRVKGLSLDMVTVSRYIYTDTVYTVLGTDIFDWFFKAVAFTILTEAPVFADSEPGLDFSAFSPNQSTFIQMVARVERLAITAESLRRVLDVRGFVFGTLCVENLMDNDRLQQLFDGNFDGADADRKQLVSESIRFAVLLTLSASVGSAPDTDAEGEFVEFLKEHKGRPVLPFESQQLLETVAKTDEYVLSLHTFQTYPELIKFSRSDTRWAVLEMESESVWGFWANEARNLLFDAITSSERPGIQFNSHLLRNITNQSCNQPVGYPVVLSNVNRSLSAS